MIILLCLNLRIKNQKPHKIAAFLIYYTIIFTLGVTMVYFCNCRERCEILAKYIIENKTTVRDAAKKFGISKSTVHKDVTEKLSQFNPTLYSEVSKILEINKSERHIRGGEATKRKYINLC